MNESIDGITITVYATQDTVEGDSFNNTYDENATYPVVNVTELKEALTNGGIDTGVNGGYGINVRKGAAVTINDGYYYGGGTAVHSGHSLMESMALYSCFAANFSAISSRQSKVCISSHTSREEMRPFRKVAKSRRSLGDLFLLSIGYPPLSIFLCVKTGFRIA